MAISAVQSCVFSAWAEVPTKVFTRSDCFRARKKQLDLPPLLVYRSDGGRGQLSMAGQKHQYPIALFIVELDPSEVAIGAALPPPPHQPPSLPPHPPPLPTPSAPPPTAP